MQNFITLGKPLGGEKYVAQKKERKIIPRIVDTSFPATPKGSACTPLGPLKVEPGKTTYKGGPDNIAT